MCRFPHIVGSIAVLACGLAPTAYSDTGDPALIAIVAEDYQTVEEFLDALTALESALIERGDARAVFAAAYRVLTMHAKSTLESGSFDDPVWAESLTVAFGNLYRQAFYDYETGNLAALPSAWRVAFDAAENENVTVFQHALLGIHAHINRDLAYAIAAVTPFNSRARHYRDYVVTNDLVVGAILDVEYLLGSEFAPPLAELDVALGAFDAELLRAVLTQWRFRAWRHAQFFDGRFPPLYERVFAWALDVRTGRLARFIAFGGDGTN